VRRFAFRLVRFRKTREWPREYAVISSPVGAAALLRRRRRRRFGSSFAFRARRASARATRPRCPAGLFGLRLRAV